MPIAVKSEDDCPKCDSSDVYEYTKAGESTRRLDCEECGAQWSAPSNK